MAALCRNGGTRRQSYLPGLDAIAERGEGGITLTGAKAPKYPPWGCRVGRCDKRDILNAIVTPPGANKGFRNFHGNHGNPKGWEWDLLGRPLLDQTLGRNLEQVLSMTLTNREVQRLVGIGNSYTVDERFKSDDRLVCH